MLSKSIVIEEVTTAEFLIGRELTAEECLQPLKILKSKEKGDLIIRRSNSWPGKISNVPRRFSYSSV